jgi:hypothetical protein
MVGRSESRYGREDEVEKLDMSASSIVNGQPRNGRGIRVRVFYFDESKK